MDRRLEKQLVRRFPFLATGTETMPPTNEIVKNLVSWHADLRKENDEEQALANKYFEAVPCSDGAVECDEEALSFGVDSPGAYVMTWTWVPVEDIGGQRCDNCGDTYFEGGGDDICESCVEKEEEC